MPARKFRLPKAVIDQLSARLGAAAEVSSVVSADVPGFGAVRAVTASTAEAANSPIRVVEAAVLAALQAK